MHSQRPCGRAGRLAVGVLLCAAASGPLALSGAAKRPITELDLLTFTWIADPQMSPDGSRVAFVRVSVNEKTDSYETSLWMVSTAGQQPPQRFTRGPSDLSPRWSPDGQQIAFSRADEKDGKQQPAQIHLIRVDGGEARALTDLPRGASAPVWSPDGKTVAVTSTTTKDDLATAQDKEDGKDQRRKSDVRVITRAVYRANDSGYLDATRRSHIWAIDVPRVAGAKPTQRQLTAGEFDEQNPRWSPDGGRIYFTSNRVSEPYYLPPDSDLYFVPAGGGEMTKAASINGPIGNFAFSSDGKRIAFTGSLTGPPVRSHNQPDLFVTETTGNTDPKNLTASYDADVGAALTGDQHAPRGGRPFAPIWSKDGRSVTVVVAEQGRANLKQIDTQTGEVKSFTTGDQEVVSYTATPDGAKVVMLVSTPTNIGDLYVVSGAGATMTRLTQINEPLFSQLSLTEPEEIWYTSFDGKRMHAWLQKPPDFDRAKKYPLILNIHGGPHAAYGYTFFHEFQWMAAKGYIVLYPNPRGSTSYGQEFGNVIQHRYPGDDHKDLMAGVDEVIKKGSVDPERLGVTGGSGGGLLTNWVVTQTDRFAAAVSQRSISDWAGFWYTADFTLFTPTWFKAPPWEDPADFAARSPITHVARVKTPLMLIEGETDYRTPPSDGGEQMFRALKYLKRPVAMVRFPGETHELSRSGKPWHRVERLQHIVSWFDKYLQGKRIDTYDLQ